MQEIIHKHWVELEIRCPQWTFARNSFLSAINTLVDCISNNGKILVCGDMDTTAEVEDITNKLLHPFVLSRPINQNLKRCIESVYPHFSGIYNALHESISVILPIKFEPLENPAVNVLEDELYLAQQVLSLARPGDSVLGISVAGNSVIVNHALRIAKALSCVTVGFSGCAGGEMVEILDIEFRAPSNLAPDIHKLHQVIYNSLCACLEEVIFGQTNYQKLQSRSANCVRHKVFPQEIALLIFDFDGVFTDNSVQVNQDGSEAVFCNRSDGLGIDLLRNAGVPMLVLSTETNPVVSARATKLKIPVEQSCKDKAHFLHSLIDKHKIMPENILYMGNDINDLPAMSMVGYVIAPADAHPAVCDIADMVTRARGGKGAIRELCDLLLEHIAHPDST